MEGVTVAACSRANCCCKGGSSDFDAGVKLTSGIDNSYGEGPGGSQQQEYPNQACA